MLAGMNGVIVAGDLFNLFVFLEIATVASYALVAFGTERHALEAAFKYAVMGTVGSLCILLGIVLLYGLTSTLNMADMREVLAGHAESNLVRMVTVAVSHGLWPQSGVGAVSCLVAGRPSRCASADFGHVIRGAD